MKFYETPEGVATRIGDEPTGLPEGWSEISGAKYDSRLAIIRAENQARKDVILISEATQRRSEFDSLVAIGVPPALAGKLTGHTVADDELLGD